MDQSGAEFFWTVDEKVHRIAGVSPSLPACREDQRATYTYSWGRFVEVLGMCWNADDTGVSWSDWGRYLICEDDEDCPEITRVEDDAFYECRAGFCQNVDLEAHPPGMPDSLRMEMLCRGDAPRYEQDKWHTPTELDLKVDAACPGHVHDPYAACTSVPDGCFDPR